MRVIAGLYKNRRINSVKGEWLRPTTDRTREFIFSWLGNLVPGTRVLDLYAGTGGLGIEAMSRGAREVTFVDSSPAAMALIRRSTEEMGISASFFRQEALVFLRAAGRQGRQYDLIFSDPPYRNQELAAMLELTATGALLAAGGLVIYETTSREEAPCPPAWQVRKSKLLGDTRVLIYGLSDDKKDSDLSGLV